MARLNSRRRNAAKALALVQAARNKAHPAIRSPKGLGTSAINVDNLLGHSHTVGFNGPDRGVGRETVILSRQGNMVKSRVTLEGSRKGFQPMEGAEKVIPYAPITGPKSARFADKAPREIYVTDEPLRGAGETILVRRGKGKFKRL